jgi:hypothetical protein
MGEVDWEGEAPAEPHVPCARRSGLRKQSLVPPIESSNLDAWGNGSHEPPAPQCHPSLRGTLSLLRAAIFRDVLSLVSGKARRGDGTTVDEEKRRMKPKSKRPFGLRRQHPICGVGRSRR